MRGPKSEEHTDFRQAYYSGRLLSGANESGSMFDSSNAEEELLPRED